MRTTSNVVFENAYLQFFKDVVFFQLYLLSVPVGRPSGPSLSVPSAHLTAHGSRLRRAHRLSTTIADATRPDATRREATRFRL